MAVVIILLQQHDVAADDQQITSSSISFYLANRKFFQEIGSDFNKSVLAGEYYLNQAIDLFDQIRNKFFEIEADIISKIITKPEFQFSIKKEDFDLWALAIKKDYFDNYSRLIRFIEASMKYFSKEYYYHASFEDIISREEIENIFKDTDSDPRLKAFFLNLKLAELDNKLQCDSSHWRELTYVKNKLLDLNIDNPIDIISLLYSKCKFLINKIEMRFRKTNPEETFVDDELLLKMKKLIELEKEKEG